MRLDLTVYFLIIQSRTGPVQGQNRDFPVYFSRTGKNLFSLQGSQLMKAGFSLCGNTTQGNPCSGPVLGLYRIAVYHWIQCCNVRQYCSGTKQLQLQLKTLLALKMKLADFRNFGKNHCEKKIGDLYIFIAPNIDLYFCP